MLGAVGLRVHAATARLLESEEHVDESGEVDAGGSAIMESGRATAAGITSRPRIWSRSSKVALAHARQRRGGGCRCAEGWGATLVQEDLPTAFFKIGSS